MRITETHAPVKRCAGVTLLVLYLVLFAPLCLLSGQALSTERFIQRLSWEPDPAASHYEVVVERLGQNRGEVLRETSAQAFLDSSLAIGQYRYQVSVYDLFGRVGAISDWAFFEVVQPRGNSVHHLNWEPEPTASYYEVVVEQQGNNNQYHEIARKITEEPFINSALPIGKYRYQVTVYDVFGNDVDSEWSYFEVIFSPPEVVEIVQPTPTPESGLELVLPEPELPEPEPELPEPEPEPPEPEPEPPEPEPEPPEPEPEPPEPEPEPAMDTVFQVAYSPLISLPPVFSFSPVGFSLKLHFIPLKAGTRALGFGFASSWNYQGVAGYILNTHLGIVFQQWLFNRVIAFNAWLGGGFSWMYNDTFSWLSSMSGGMSFQWFIRRPFFVTLGVDAAYIFSSDSPLYVQPSLGFGWNF